MCQSFCLFVLYLCVFVCECDVHSALLSFYKKFLMKIFSFPPPKLPGLDQFCFFHVGGSCICLNNYVSLLLCTVEDLVTQ